MKAFYQKPQKTESFFTFFGKEEGSADEF